MVARIIFPDLPLFSSLRPLLIILPAAMEAGTPSMCARQDLPQRFIFADSIVLQGSTVRPL